MSGDKELFEMMSNRGKSASQLPGKAVHFIPEEDAPLVLAIDQRIQEIHEYRWAIIAAVMLLSFLIGTAL